MTNEPLNSELNDETPKQEGSTPQVEAPLSRKEAEQAKRDTKAFYKQQVELLKPQVELMELRWKLSKYTFENYQYSIKLNEINQGFQNGPQPGKPEMFDHEVTQEDLDNNPEMVEAGLNVGDKIQITQKPNLKAGESGVVEPSTAASEDVPQTDDADGTGND